MGRVISLSHFATSESGRSLPYSYQLKTNLRTDNASPFAFSGQRLASSSNPLETVKSFLAQSFWRDNIKRLAAAPWLGKKKTLGYQDRSEILSWKNCSKCRGRNGEKRQHYFTTSLIWLYLREIKLLITLLELHFANSPCYHQTAHSLASYVVSDSKCFYWRLYQLNLKVAIKHKLGCVCRGGKKKENPREFEKSIHSQTESRLLHSVLILTFLTVAKKWETPVKCSQRRLAAQFSDFPQGVVRDKSLYSWVDVRQMSKKNHIKLFKKRTSRVTIYASWRYGRSDNCDKTSV